MYETPACTIIPLATEYALLTKSPVARPGKGGEPGHKGNIDVIEAPIDDEGDDDVVEG